MKIRVAFKSVFAFLTLSCLLLAGCSTASDGGKLTNEKCKALEKLTKDAADKYVELTIQEVEALESGDANVDEIKAEAAAAMADVEKYGAEMDAGGCEMSK